MTTYYTLCIVDHRGVYMPEFGDYDRETVEQEMRDAKDSGETNAMRIIVSGDTQSEINAAVADLNARRENVERVRKNIAAR